MKQYQEDHSPRCRLSGRPAGKLLMSLPLIGALGLAAGPQAVSADMLQRATEAGCMGCHFVDRDHPVGPSYQDVAERYRGQDVTDKLVAKVREGGSGEWGQQFMTPNAWVDDHFGEGTLESLVEWILSQ